MNNPGVKVPLAERGEKTPEFLAAVKGKLPKVGGYARPKKTMGKKITVGDMMQGLDQ